MKIALIVLGALVLLVVIIIAIGFALPRAHVASRTATFHQPPQAVWDAVTNIDSMKSWRSNLESMERLPDENARPVWREKVGGMSITLSVTEWNPPTRMVTRIADTGLPFGGEWVYEIAPTPTGASLTITENGEIYNPIFRFVARFFLGYTSTMDTYLKDLSRKFGEPALGATARL